MASIEIENIIIKNPIHKRDYAEFRDVLKVRWTYHNLRNNIIPTPEDHEVFENKCDELWSATDDQFKAKIFAEHAKHESDALDNQIARGMRWTSSGFLIVKLKDNDIKVSPANFRWGIGDRGEFYGPDPLKPDAPLIGVMHKVSEETIKTISSGWTGILNIPFLALSFMHCKNVRINENKPPDKVQHKREKRGKLPLIRYYTLEIEALKTILKNGMFYLTYPEKRGINEG